MVHIGENIKIILKRRGVPYADIAELLEMKENSIYKMLQKPNQDSATLEAIAAFLEIPVTDFFTMAENSDADPVGEAQKTARKVKEKKTEFLSMDYISNLIEQASAPLREQIEELKRDKMFLQGMLAKLWGNRKQADWYFFFVNRTNSVAQTQNRLNNIKEGAL